MFPKKADSMYILGSLRKTCWFSTAVSFAVIQTGTIAAVGALC
jgi:hypothetical protein